MNKNDVLKILKELDFPTDEFYLLSGGSLVLRGIRDVCSDVDLCISTELFEKIKDEYHLTDDKKNKCGFYKLSDNIEVVVNDKDDFKMNPSSPYNLEDLETILEFKKRVNRPKDQIDIQRIEAYLAEQER